MALTKSFSQILFNTLSQYKSTSTKIKFIPLDEEGVPLAKTKEQVKVCDYCGPFEECNKKLHGKAYLRDLLIDAGIVENSTAAFNSWWHSKHQDEDPRGILLGYDPQTVYDVYPDRVAKFVRSIL